MIDQVYIALGYFIVSAVVMVYLGSTRQLHAAGPKGGVAMKDALWIPVVGSLTLVSLYIAFKYLPQNIVNFLISLYLSLGGTIALTVLIKPLIKPSIFTALSCVCVSLVYVFTHHWIPNNLIAFALGVVAVESISLGSFTTSFVLLILLFAYDIFWVFGTEVMVSVATNVKGPIMLLFPQTILGDHTKKSLLGLGDIIVPGIFIAQTLLFSQKCVKRGNLYFNVALVAYVSSLVLTMTMLQIYKHGQPALLYIVPSLLLSFLGTLVIMGDVRAALNFDSADYSEPADENEQNMDDLLFFQGVMLLIKEMCGLDEAPSEKAKKRSPRSNSKPKGVTPEKRKRSTSAKKPKTR